MSEGLGITKYDSGDVMISRGSDMVYMTRTEAQSLYQTLAGVMGVTTITVFPRTPAVTQEPAKEPTQPYPVHVYDQNRP